MARQGYLSLRLTTQERELYQELANRKGVPLADWIRSSLVIVAYLEKAEKKDGENYGPLLACPFGKVECRSTR